MAKPSKLALAVAGARKIIGAGAAKPQMVMMPKTVSELHVAGPEKDAKGNVTSDGSMIPHDTLLTPEVCDEAGLEDETIQDLIDRGHVVLVEVYAGALTEGDEGANA